MKKTNTKRALGMSLISLLACGIMFAGSTYAWFTDEVVASGNKIETGTLKVDLEVLEGTSWKSLRDSSEAVFSGGLWEPGYTDYAVFKIENEGNLAVKWNLKAVKVGADSKNLAEVIDVYALVSDTELANTTSLKETGYEKVGTLAKVLEDGTLLEGTFDSNTKLTAKYLGIMLHMQEEAGNEYQGATDVEFDIKLNAYQLAQEQDGFNNPNYDVNAYFDGKPADSFADDLSDNVLEIATPAEFALFANTVNKDGTIYSGKTIKLTNDINLSNQPWTPIGQTGGNGVATYFRGTFDGNGHTISNLSITAQSEGQHYSTGLFGFIDAGAATIKNLTVDNATVNGHHWTGVIAGYLTGTIDNCKVLNSTVNCTIANDDANGDKVGALVGYVNESSSVVSNSLVDNCEVTGYRDVGGVAGGGNGKLTNNTVKNSTITSTTTNNAQVAGEIVGKRFESIVENCSTENNTLNHYAEINVSTDDQFKTALSLNNEKITINLGNDVSLKVGNPYPLGGANTEEIIINGNGHEFMLDSTYMSTLTTTNPNAKVIINDADLNSNKASGTWDIYDFNFSCDVELNNVNVLKSLALEADAKLTNVTITESHDYYAIWVCANGQTVELDNVNINSQGRAVKIDAEYVDAPALVTFVVKNSSFASNKKAAILVDTPAGANITVQNLDISGCKADTVNAVWVDSDSKDYADKVTVTGASKYIEQ